MCNECRARRAVRIRRESLPLINNLREESALPRLSTTVAAPRRTNRKAPGKTAAAPGRAKPGRLTGARPSVLAAAKALQAAVRSGDVATTKKLLARGFTFIDASGHEHSRRSVLRALKASPRNGGTQVKVHDYGRVALITGSYKSAQAGERSDLFALDVWIKEAGEWKALIHHNNVLARPDEPPAHTPAAPRSMDAAPPRCQNPLEIVPYKPKSQAERDIIAAFQALELAVTRNDPDEWQKHVADEFVVTRTRQHPTDKAARHGVHGDTAGDQCRDLRRRGCHAEILGARRRHDHARRSRHAGRPPAALPRDQALGKARRPLANGDQPADDHPAVRRFVAAAWRVAPVIMG
ncbi:MAG: DUF4440 domain-containing protein [Rhizobiales bacterium]|nr:DUF4440 domain-containing protein [Hyphomicrobiales bacterium]